MMAVTRRNGGKRPGGGGGRARPDFTPSKSTGLYLRFDCVAGRAKIVGHASGELFSRKCRFNIDIAKLEAGWLDFQANAESAIVGTDRNNPPPGAGAQRRPEVGCRGAGRDALRDDLRRRRDQGGRRPA